MDIENSSNLSTYLSRYFRDHAIEVFQCRHCSIEEKTSNSSYCAALLCNECFDARAKYRIDFPMHSKNKPVDYDEKAENTLFGDRFGEDRTLVSVVCASCENVYELVPKEYVDHTSDSIEFAKKHYDATFAFHKGKKPFKPPIVLKYKHAPKGWTNNILCENCLYEFLAEYGDEIKELDKRQSETECLKQEELKRAEIEMAKPTKSPLKEEHIAIIAFYLMGFYSLAEDYMAVGVFFIIVATMIFGFSAANRDKQ